MKIIKIISGLILGLHTIAATAQDTGIFYNRLNAGSNRLDGKLTGETYYMNSLSNSNFFLQSDWALADITLENNMVFTGVKARYLAYGDELIVYNDNLKLLYKTDKEKIKEFSMNDGSLTRHFVKRFYNGFFAGERYFELLYSGTRQLLVFHHVESLKVTPFVDQSGVMRDTRYRLAKTYYMDLGKNELAKMQVNRRSFIRNFPEKKKEIRKTFRQNKINMIGESALVQAFELLDKAGLLK